MNRCGTVSRLTAARQPLIREHTAITNAYASGAVTGTDAVGGLIGQLSGGSIANAYWDEYSTGQQLSFGSFVNAPTATTVQPVTSDPAAVPGRVSNSAYDPAAYANLPGAANLGSATVDGFAFIPGGTRPFLAFEVPVAGNPLVNTANGVTTLANSHQLQLLNYNAATQAGSYTLRANIDLAETGRVVVGTPGSYSGMWAGTGFVSLGSDGAGNLWDGSNFVAVGYADVGKAGSATGFRGNLAGGGFTLSNLTVNRVGVQNVGLLGGSSGAISNLSVTGNVTGYVSVGGLVGCSRAAASAA